MPAKSKAQMRKLFSLAGQGKIGMKVAKEFAVKGAAYRRLPERIGTRKSKGGLRVKLATAARGGY